MTRLISISDLRPNSIAFKRKRRSGLSIIRLVLRPRAVEIRLSHYLPLIKYFEITYFPELYNQMDQQPPPASETGVVR